jgi:hypothetical protein
MYPLRDTSRNRLMKYRYINRVILLIIALSLVWVAYNYSNRTIDTASEIESVQTEQDIPVSAGPSSSAVNQDKVVLPSFLSKANFYHIFHGGINRRGEATGFHHLPTGKGPETDIIKIIKPNNTCGIYLAQVKIEGQTKRAYSTMFPDRLTTNQVLESIITGYNNYKSNPTTNRTITVQTNECYRITIIIDNNAKIITTYPLYD